MIEDKIKLVLGNLLLENISLAFQLEQARGELAKAQTELAKLSDRKSNGKAEEVGDTEWQEVERAVS